MDGEPAIVIDEFVLALSESPTGSEPLAIDQEDGATPRVAVQMAVYVMPMIAGPAGGAQPKVNGTAAVVATVRLAAPEAGPSEAVMVVVPGATPVAFPAAVMVATPGADDVQLAWPVTSRLLPSAKIPMALN